jgi:DNA polymerase
MPLLVWDCETRSAASLRECGSHIYSRDPSTQVLCVAYATDDEEPRLWTPGDCVPPAFFEAGKLVAHNYFFEIDILKNILVPRHGFPAIPDEAWHCTQRLALANGYPPELDTLALALGLPYRKDPAARKAMLQVSKPRANRKRKAGTIPAWDEDPEKLKLLYERCLQDVVTARAVWNHPKLRPLSALERRYQLQDLAINSRGIRLDRAFAASARDLAIRERVAAGQRLDELTGGAITTPNQCKRILEAVNGHGGGMVSLDARAVAKALEDKPADFVRQLLELRRGAARSSVTKFNRMLAYAAPTDDRLRGTLRMYGAGPGRWVGLGPQLQNLKKNEAQLPLSVVDSIRSGDREDLAQFGAPLSLLGDLSRAALCAKEGHVLLSGDFSAVESVVLAWLAGEGWKLRAYTAFLETRDTQLEPYRVIARRMLHKAPDAEISPEERQLGKAGELACGFGGSVGAWRRIVHHDERSDEEILAIIRQWRDAHPQTRKFWNDVALACRVAIKTGQPYQVAPPAGFFGTPHPPITAAFEGGNLVLTLPSGRPITYPGARLVSSKFEDGPSDIEFFDNARGQWKPYRAWFGTLVENVVQGTARDLLAAAVDRFESRGIPVVFHCHDEVTAEVPIGSLSEEEFLAILLELPQWAEGLPLGGKVHSGEHYLEPPEQPTAVREDTECQIEDPDVYADIARAEHEAFIASLGGRL